MALFVSKRFLAQCRRSVRMVDHAYNIVTTPITFCELSFDDIPDQIPCRDMVTCLASNIPNFSNVCTVYDNVSIDKDIVESIVSLWKQSSNISCMSDKEKILYVLKCLSLLYKTLIVHSPLHEEHTLILNILDYLNFMVSFY